MDREILSRCVGDRLDRCVYPHGVCHLVVFRRQCDFVIVHLDQVVVHACLEVAVLLFLSYLGAVVFLLHLAGDLSSDPILVEVLHDLEAAHLFLLVVALDDLVDRVVGDRVGHCTGRVLLLPVVVFGLQEVDLVQNMRLAVDLLALVGNHRLAHSVLLVLKNRLPLAVARDHLRD